MSRFESMAAKIRTIETRQEMAAFLDALRVEAPDLFCDAKLQIVVGEQNAKIYRNRIVSAEADSWRKK